MSQQGQCKYRVLPFGGSQDARGYRRRIVHGVGSIEVVSILAVLSVLIVLLLPVLITARRQMASARCLDNLRQMGAATGMYLQDYDATFPFAWGMPGPYDWNTWATGLAPYLKLPKGDADHIRNAPVFHCPADDDGPSPISYATNALISGAYWEEDRWKTTRIYPAENLASITNLAQVVWIGDTNKGDWNRTKQFDDTITDWVRPDIELGYPKTDDRAVAFYRQWLKERDWTDLKAAALDCPDGLYRCKYPAFRHARKGPRSGYADFLFVDGHVKACRWGQLNIVNFFPAPTPQQISKYNQ